MTPGNNSTTQPIHAAPAGKRMLQGAGIALILIAAFLLTADEPKPEWHKLWMLRPLIIVPLSGAAGGLFYYFTDYQRYKGGWKKFLTNVLCLIVYIIGLWMGTVVGLDGTMWD